MKNKKIILGTIIIIICVLIVSGIIMAIRKNAENNDEISQGYIAVFHGVSGEITNETYIYKKNNGHANSGFTYINTTNTTESWGSSQIKTKITKRGSVQWTDDVFKVAKENNAYLYVTVPNNDKKYTIEEFRQMFIMD